MALRIVETNKQKKDKPSEKLVELAENMHLDLLFHGVIVCISFLANKSVLDAIKG